MHCNGPNKRTGFVRVLMSCASPPPPCPTNAVSNEHFHLDRMF